MTALFCLPLSFTVVSANQSTNSPASNANSDIPSLVWKSSNLTTVNVIIDLGTSASYDTVALVGTNLRSSDTFTVRTGPTNTGVGSYNVAATATAAHAETVTTGCTAKSLLQLGSTRTERYMRIDITSTSNPDTFVSMQRLVVGKALTTTGLAAQAERQFEDQSVQYQGPGWESFDIYNKLNGWKVTTAWISNSLMKTAWHPFLMQAGRSTGILFTPNVEEATPCADMVFGRLLTERTVAKQDFYDAWSCDLQIQALAP